MISQIIGDMIGSRYESTRNKNPGVPLWGNDCVMTDDSLMTLALTQWKIQALSVQRPDYQEKYEWVRGVGFDHPGPWMLSMGLRHMERGFGASFIQWLRGGNPHRSYGSWGNGAVMRVGALASLASSMEEALKWAKESVSPTHEHLQSIQGAQCVVWGIRRAFEWQSACGDPALARKEWLNEFITHWGPSGIMVASDMHYPDVRSWSLSKLREEHMFDVSTQGTVPLAFWIAASTTSFEEAMDVCVSIGGDADTLASIVAGFVEGFDGWPMDYMEKALRRQEWWFDPEWQEIVLAWSRSEQVQSFYQAFNREIPDIVAWWEQGPDMTASFHHWHPHEPA